MKTLGRLFGFVLALFGLRRVRPWRPAFPVQQYFVQGQLSAGTIYRLLHDCPGETARVAAARDVALPA